MSWGTIGKSIAVVAGLATIAITGYNTIKTSEHDQKINTLENKAATDNNAQRPQTQPYQINTNVINSPGAQVNITINNGLETRVQATSNTPPNNNNTIMQETTLTVNFDKPLTKTLAEYVIQKINTSPYRATQQVGDAERAYIYHSMNPNNTVTEANVKDYYKKKLNSIMRSAPTSTTETTTTHSFTTPNYVVANERDKQKIEARIANKAKDAKATNNNFWKAYQLELAAKHDRATRSDNTVTLGQEAVKAYIDR